MSSKNRAEKEKYHQQQSQIAAYLTGEIRRGKYYFHSLEIAEASDIPTRVVSAYLAFLKKHPGTSALLVTSRSFTRSTIWEIHENSAAEIMLDRIAEENPGRGLQQKGIEDGCS